MLKVPASRAPSTCMPPASPRSCIDATTCMDTPVAPMGWPFALSPPEGLTGSRPSFSVQPSSTARAPSPGFVSPMASYSMSSAIVKQSWVSTRLRSPTESFASSRACDQARAHPSRKVMSRRLIGRNSLTWLRARNTTALSRASAVSMSASTTAAAPSVTSEQSVRLSGLATIGFFSETSRQNS